MCRVGCATPIIVPASAFTEPGGRRQNQVLSLPACSHASHSCRCQVISALLSGSRGVLAYSRALGFVFTAHRTFSLAPGCHRYSVPMNKPDPERIGFTSG